MATKIVSILTAGTNNHTESSANANAWATDFLSSGVVGPLGNTASVAPATGNYAVNAQGSPNMTVAVSGGTLYTLVTPAGQTSQRVRVVMNASENVTIPANASGGTRYDWIYMSVDATLANNPDVTATTVATLVNSRSTSGTTDNGTPPTYGQLLAIVTVANGAVSIANANIADSRALSGMSLVNGADGWTLVTDAWVYFSPTAITVPSDATLRYAVGDRIKLTQTTVKYFVVTAVTSTTISITGGSDYTLANATITNPYYSKSLTPMGYPQWFNYAESWTGFSTAPSGGISRFAVNGRTVFFNINRTVAGTSNAGPGTISLPITSATVTGAFWNSHMRGINNGVTLATPSLVQVASASSTAPYYQDSAGNNFGAASSKLILGIITYEI